jgi:hypothetical protein
MDMGTATAMAIVLARPSEVAEDDVGAIEDGVDGNTRDETDGVSIDAGVLAVTGSDKMVVGNVDQMVSVPMVMGVGEADAANQRG